MLYATIIACWMGLGCMLAESDMNPFEDRLACETEVERMVPIMKTYVDPQWGVAREVIGSCLTKQELMDTLGK